MFIKKLIVITFCIFFICIIYKFSNKIKLFNSVFNKNPYENYIVKYSDYFNIDPLLIKIIIKNESNLSCDAVSKKGAIGLMQIMPETALEIANKLKIVDYSNSKLKNAEINIMFGTYYLRKLLDRYDGNLILALIAYNAGLRNVQNWYNNDNMFFKKIHSIPFVETKNYVISILLTYRLYKFLNSFSNFILLKNIDKLKA
ncbi:MAG: lytic transglycosylase domain-containing protein [Endomicrobium sp.]|jgi:soluble lytic murein transglycosylase|nr:lytic transglycosylase domain-containing protein [Endomicrobium sp.]